MLQLSYCVTTTICSDISLYLDVEHQRLKQINIGAIPAYTNNPFGLLINIDYFTCASVCMQGR